MRSVSATLAAAQTATSRVPYFHCVFTAKSGGVTFDCSGSTSRIMKIAHVTVPYLGNYAKITLNNQDRGVPALRGYYVEIGYGDVTGAGNEYQATARMEVVYQETESLFSSGKVNSILYCIGTPDRLSKIPVMIGSAPDYYTLYDRNTTVFNILSVLFTEGGCTLNAIPKEPSSGTNTADAGTNTTTLVDSALTSSDDDYYNGWYLYNTTRSAGAVITNYVGSTKTITCETIASQTSGDTYYIIKGDEIISSFTPYFEINSDNTVNVTYSHESIQSAYYRAIMMTKSYLRERESNTFDVVYPRDNDAVDLTINTTSVPWFYEYYHRHNELDYNAVYVFANKSNDETDPWASMITGYAVDSDAVTRNGGVEKPYLSYAPTLTTQADANARAGAILTRIKAETLAQGVVIPFDCRLELYDNVEVSDTRGY